MADKLSIDPAAAGQPIVVRLPNGQEAEFPAGTRPEVIQAVIERMKPPAAAPNPAATGQKSPGDTPGQPSGPPPGWLADNFLTRAVRGAVTSRIDPAAEMLVRGARRIGLADDADVADVQAKNAERRQLQADSRKRIGDTGIDLADLTGTAALDYAATAGLGGWLNKPNLVTPRNIPDLAKTGALVGGISGVIGPVEGSEGMTDADLARQKGVRGIAGTVIGGLASPVAGVATEKAVTGTVDLLRKGARAMAGVVSPSNAQRVVNDARTLEAYLIAQAQEVGVDWARVPDALKESFRQATRRATSTTGELPEQAVRNRLLAESERLPPLTVGQATRDPSQFSREANSPDDELRALLGDQQQAATTRLQEIPRRFGPERSPYETGALVADDIAAQAAARRKEISELYGAFRSEAAGYHRINNTPDFVKNAQVELKTQQLYDELPPVFRSQLEELEKSGERLSIREAAQLWKNVNQYLSTTRGTPQGAALGTLKTELAKLMDDAKFTNTDKGDDVIKMFREANQKRREMGQWEESSTAIAALAERAPKLAVERVMDRFVLGGSVKDFTGLWSTLTPDVQRAVKTQFVNAVVNKAMNQYGTMGTRPGAAVEFLRNYPREKLSRMFSADELVSLRNTLEYMRLTKEAPPGNFVNRSGTAIDLKDFLANSSNLPVVGPMVTKPLRALQEQLEAQRAMSGALAAPPAARPSPLSQALVPRVPFGIAPGGAGALNAPREEDE